MDTVEIIKAVVFGVVQGVTEWLPISSTGHMILLDEFLQLDMTPEFMEMFYVVIQLGAILAVLFLFWSKLCPVSFHGKPHLKKDVLALWPKIIVACIPAGVIGILWSDMLNALFFHPLVVITMLALFGVLFLVVEHQNKERTPTIESVEKLTYQAALWIGMFQLIAAVLPGTSRSGATIIGARIIGVSRVAAAEFTFMMAVPVMFGASAIKLMSFGIKFTAIECAVLLTGMLVAFLVSIISIRFLMSFIKKHDFRIFGWYRIALAAAAAIYFGFIE
ncbi:undecaprenyl-diphosphate phosphatase [Faecalibacterium gallinarum]|uniref:Undecaprenyl-diphosphatase n=1 Tax=Faecalibacterium gallinarum TaxID=2903556 RepID=A0AA37IW72_9FIRM|nr:undecaprenyl-diphosphate phosphatase [Faecalibacterium gallinarum]GJN63409.1 undecaprenyl-diphosphatase 1 [Faecalibacterium gallinarum]